MAGQRFSYQREQIYQAVCGSREHPTAEMVYHWLKPDLPRLSLGTVYRNLHQMAQEGRLTEMEGPAVRFDANTQPHAHLRCTRCGGVSDLNGLVYDRSLDRLAEGNGCRVLGHTLFFTGICPACVDKQDQKTDYYLKGETQIWN